MKILYKLSVIMVTVMGELEDGRNTLVLLTRGCQDFSNGAVLEITTLSDNLRIKQLIMG